jgi:hypothetical protein
MNNFTKPGKGSLNLKFGTSGSKKTENLHRKGNEIIYFHSKSYKHIGREIDSI